MTLSRRFVPAILFALTGYLTLFFVSRIAANTSWQNTPPGFYRGIYHVHSEFSLDSKATLQQILQTAQKSNLDFVVVTDHNNRNGKSAYESMKKPLAPLLIFGEEISTPDGHMISIGVEETHGRSNDSQELINWIHARNGFALLAHPWCKKNPWKNWEVNGYDGLEVYNFTHSFYTKNKVISPLKTVLLTHPRFLKSHLPSEHSDLEFWDQKLNERAIAGISAADAHLHVKILGMSLESLNLQFQSSALYVYANGLEERPIVESLGKGRSFIAFETFGDARQFKFTGRTSSGKSFGPGETVNHEAPIQLLVETPLDSEIRLLRNGEVMQKETGRKLDLEVHQTGAYRAEAYRDGKLWIVTNPIYVEP